MLDLMRRKAQSPYIQATIVIIILVFVFWGVGTNNGAGRNDAATVNGQSISIQAYQQAYDRKIEEVRQQFGGSVPDQVLKMMNIRQQVINGLIDQALVMQGAQEMGLQVSDDEVRRTIQSMGSFQYNGAFDVRIYKDILTRNRLTPAKFEASIRTDTLTQKAVDSLERFAQITQADLQNQYIYNYETTSLAYLNFTAKEFTGKVKTTDDALNAFFDKHKNNYKTAPQRKISYLFFTKKSAVVPTEAELKSYYEQHRNEFKIPEQRSARHILLRSDPKDDKKTKSERYEKMKKILAEAKGGADFSELAKKYSQDGTAKKGGDLGFIRRGKALPAFEKAVFAMQKEGEISDIVETKYGLHIIKVDLISYAGHYDFSDVKDLLMRRLMEQKSGGAALKAASDAYEQIILAGSLKKYAENNNIKLNTTDFFTKTGAPKDLAKMPSLLANAFTLNKGELSSLVDDPGGYSIIFIEDSKAPEVPPMDNVVVRVKKDFVDAEAKILAEKAAQELLDALKNGSTIKTEANKLGRTVKVETYSRMERSKSKLPGEILNKGLELSVNTPVTNKVIASNNDFYVISLQERKDPPADQMAAKDKELREQMLQENKIKLVNAWLANLKDNAEITINPQLLVQ